MATRSDDTKRAVPEDDARVINRDMLAEESLRLHPGVREVAVVRDGAKGNRAFVVADDVYMDNVLGRRSAETTLLGKWRKTYDLTQFTKNVASAPVGFNTLGWNSSYTRQAIPAEEMREWVQTTVADVLLLAPKKLYEIGCGTGMLLMRIAPHCERYVAVDFSPVILERVREQLQSVPPVAKRVEVLERTADNFDGLDEDSFDMVVLNSVVQYFPNVAYLTRVLENAVKIVKPGGYVFVGDVRCLPLLPTFACSVELFRAADEVSIGELRDRIQRRIRLEQELVLSPSYFLFLQRQFPKISRVEIRPQRGRADNEMSRYRYNAILHVGSGMEPSPESTFLGWTERELTLDDIRSMLQQRPSESIGIKGIRNARIENDLATLKRLRTADASYTAGDLRREGEQTVKRGILPQDLLDLGTDDLGFHGFLSWAACRVDGSYDALFIPTRSLRQSPFPAIRWPEPNPRDFVYCANAPAQTKFRSELVSQLLMHCRQHLPAEVVPADITLVDALARTKDGDVDPDELLAAKTACI